MVTLARLGRACVLVVGRWNVIAAHGLALALGLGLVVSLGLGLGLEVGATTTIAVALGPLVESAVSYRDDYKVDVPIGESGQWSVRKKIVTKKDEEFGAMRAAFSGGGIRGRYVPAGTYTGLHRREEVIMSDTPDEIRDHSRFIHRARGRVLIAGLGLGVVLQAVARKPEVSEVTVIEQSLDVIKLVESHWRTKDWGLKFHVNQASIFEWKPLKGATFDCAWFDIWDGLCTDNLAEMGRLSRRFARCVPDRGFWGHSLLKAQKREERARGW